MNKGLLSNVLIEQNKHWTGKKYRNFFEREMTNIVLEHIDQKMIHIILGVRRSGKSTLLKLIINKLANKKPEKILYINFDDIVFTPYYDNLELILTLVNISEELTGIKPEYLFLDEIQNIPKWEKWVKSKYDSHSFKEIFITGSNSKLLETQYTERLSGRYFLYELYPLSFKEFLKKEKINLKNKIDLITKKSLILREFSEYLIHGGFPQKINKKFLKELHKTYYNTIIQKDCIIQHKVRNPLLFNKLAYYLLSNIAKPYTYNSLAKIMNSNENTIQEYIKILESSYLVFEVYPFSYSLKKQFKNEKKIYSIDTGLANSISFKFSEDKGRLLENLVFIELKRRNKEVYYHRGKKECDFVIKEGLDIVEAIQVATSLEDPETRKREVSGLVDAMKTYNLKEGLILTEDEEDKFIEKDKKTGKEFRIRVMPVWKFLLDYENPRVNRNFYNLHN